MQAPQAARAVVACSVARGVSRCMLRCLMPRFVTRVSQRSYTRALGGDDQHAQADTSPRFRKTPYAPALVRSTARARLWQRNGRCIRVKLACKMTRGPPRLHSPAFSRPHRVNSDTRRPLGARRNAHLRAARQESSPSKQVLLAKWGVKVGALSADLASRLGKYSSKHCETTLDHRCGRGDAKPRLRASAVCNGRG